MSELAILGGPKTRAENYPDWPVWDERDVQAVTEVVRSGRWGGFPFPGAKTAELAAKAASVIDCGPPHALGGGPKAPNEFSV